MRELYSHALARTIKTCAACQSKFGDKTDQDLKGPQGNALSLTPPGSFCTAPRGLRRHTRIFVGSGRGVLMRGAFCTAGLNVVWVLEGFTQGPQTRIPEHRCCRFRVGDLFHGSPS